MKSIMEQASSIIKAIEKAWLRADKPQGFTVKIFEQEQKNFFGITTKPAKIGIFFQEKPVKPTKEQRPYKKISPETKPKPAFKKPFKKEQYRSAWHDDMVTVAHAWIKKSLVLMGLPNINFTTDIAGNNLRITFDTPLIYSNMQERKLFRSFAYLIMATLRNQFKQEFKNLKVVLTRN